MNHTTERPRGTAWDPDDLRVVAVVPARGGSKGIPRKNLQVVGGVPLVVRTIRALSATPEVGLVVVTTDDAAIASVAKGAGAEVVVRPAELASDVSSSESALLHALQELGARGVRPRVTVFAQATSPFIDPSDVSAAITAVSDGQHDVVFSAFASHGFLWSEGPDGARGLNHDHRSRQRRQDREPQYQESGAFYVMDTEGFTRSGFRFFGRVGIQPVAESTAIEIDTVGQLQLAQLMATRPGSTARAEDEPAISGVVTDFDGVHTADRVTVDEHGVESVTVNRSDGMGIALLRAAGLPVLILSTERNGVVAARARKLGVEAVTGCDDKLTALQKWASRHRLCLGDVAYLGNDVNDLDCLRAVGWPVAVPDAHPAVLHAARLVLSRRGGDGAVRELAERILESTARTSPRDEGHQSHG